MNSQVAAIAETLIIYIFIASAYYGWGKVATRVLGFSTTSAQPGTTLIWLGWSVNLTILQLVHFFTSITANLVFPIYFFGAIYAVPHAIFALRLPQDRSSWIKVSIAAAAILIAVSWIASRSMMDPTNYDSGLYHFNAIRWINSAPLIPGLGNLHGRLAFNQAFFTYVAALNFYPLLGYGRSIANSFLLLLMLASLIYSLRPVFQKPSLLLESHPFEFYSALLAIPILAYLALSSDNLASPSPDLAAILLQLTIFVMTCQVIAVWKKRDDRLEEQIIIIAILAATAVTVKLSNLAFSSVTIVMCLISASVMLNNRLRRFLQIVLPVLLILLIWTASGIILSGCPLYPSTIGRLSLDWSVPISQVQEEAEWVYSWAREPGPHWSKVIGNWRWLGSWFGRIIHQRVEIVYPSLLSIILWILTAKIVIKPLSPSMKCDNRLFDWISIFPVVIGIAFWFFTAPDPRFVHALFWCLALSSALIFIRYIKPSLTRRSLAIILCIVFLTTNYFFIYELYKKRHILKEISFSGWRVTRTVPLSRKQTASGLVVYVPTQGYQCWDSPLPCTPYFNTDLRQRIPGKLESGYSILYLKPRDNNVQEHDSSENKRLDPQSIVQNHIQALTEPFNYEFVFP